MAVIVADRGAMRFVRVGLAVGDGARRRTVEAANDAAADQACGVAVVVLVAAVLRGSAAAARADRVAVPRFLAEAGRVGAVVPRFLAEAGRVGAVVRPGSVVGRM